jgi:trigger factor
VTRPAASGDIIVVNYTGACDGKPITETAPAATSLAEAKHFWVSTEPNAFIPGFAEQLLGAQAGDKRTVTIQFPAEFPTKELASKQAVFEVEVLEIKVKVLPPLDDAFAKSYDAENVEKLKAGVRRDLENELKFKQSKDTRGQVLRALLGRVNFDLPESAVAHETRNVVYDLVRENTQRGVAREVIEREKDQIYSAAAHSAKERVKLAFLIQRIAEKEEIKVSQEEILRRVQALAAIYQIPPDKFLKDLQKRNGLIEIYDDLARDKVIEFLEQNAKFEEATPAGGNPS